VDRRPEDEMSERVLGMGIGIVIGAWLGILLDNLALGTAMATGIVVATGAGLAASHEDGNDGDG
jgi:uncharacterized membrane protein YccC